MHFVYPPSELLVCWVLLFLVTVSAESVKSVKFVVR